MSPTKRSSMSLGWRQPVAPPSFVPQIASLGDLMDTISERRMQIAKMQHDDDVLAQKDAYGRRKQDVIEKRDNANEMFKQEEHNSKQRKYVRDQVGSGRNPGTVTYWKDGQPVTVQYTFEGGQIVEKPEPAQMAAQPAPEPTTPPAPDPQGQPVPTMMGKPLMRSTLGEGPGQLPIQQPALPPAQPEMAQAPAKPEPELDALMSRATQPQEPQAQDNTIFLDENDEGTTRALLPPGDTGLAELPMRAYPEGARVGDRFAAEDVNLKGGYGNPFAGPVYPAQMRRQPDGGTVFFDENNDGTARALTGPDDSQSSDVPVDSFPPGAQPGQRFAKEDVGTGGMKGNPFAEPVPPAEMPQTNRDADGTNNLLGVQPPTSTSKFVPGRQIQGASAAMPQSSGAGRWVARDKSGAEFDSVDMGEARKAKNDEDARQLQAINEALASPEAKLDPRMSQALITEKVSLLGRMSPDARKTMFAMQKQGQQIESTEGMLGKKLDAQAEQGDMNRASREKMAADANATRRATSKYGRAGSGGGKAATQSSGPGSAFAAMKPTEQFRIENAVNNGIRMLDTQMNWTKLEGVGFDRLNLALQNIRAKGEVAGVQQMEAMMNFFGYIRGGVPAKNETDEFKSITRTLGTTLDSLGQKVGVKDLWTNFTGSEADKAAIAKIAKLPEGQRAGLEQAIVESQRAIQGMALKNIAAQIEGYKSAGRPFHERAQDKINAKLRFIGEKPRQWFADSPLIPDFQAGEVPGAQPGGAKPSLRELLGD